MKYILQIVLRVFGGTAALIALFYLGLLVTAWL